METKLSQNIRLFRKERSLTQEQLAEVLGVTAGAVYKWEAKLSVPELDLIVEMADFFDTSVDVLLGYEIKDNRLETTIKRLRDCRRNKNWSGISEAEKALKKYPQNFRVVNESAAMYRAAAFERGKKEDYNRALELLEQARLLLAQNTDPEISEQTLSAKMAEVYVGLDEWEKAVAMLKQHNAGGLYNHKIGSVLAMNEQTDEAVPFLSEALAQIVSELINTVTGYSNVYASRNDYASVQAILEMGITLLCGLRKDGKPNFLDKVSSGFLTALAYAQLASCDSNGAYESLKKAKALAAFFDKNPSYDESDILFIDRIEGASIHDDIGATAADVICNLVNEFDDEAFTALWKTVNEERVNENND